MKQKYPTYLKMGDKYNRLTVLHPDESKNKSKPPSAWYYVCECECGKIKSIGHGALVSGGTKSCGCYRNEQVYKASKVYKPINLKKEIAEIELKPGIITIVDRDQVERVQEHTWQYSADGYAVSSKLGRMHRFLLNAPADKVVDHINQNKLDNRISNLRLCSRAENGRNCDIPKNNTSGIKGVWYDKRQNRWCAELMYNRKKIYLGSYKTKEEAGLARLTGEVEYFGEYAHNEYREKLNENNSNG